MTLRGTDNEVQLATLTKILDKYCRQAGIAGSHPAREDLVSRLMALFVGGRIDSPDENRMALDSIGNDWRGHVGTGHVA